MSSYGSGECDVCGEDCVLLVDVIEELDDVLAEFGCPDDAAEICDISAEGDWACVDCMDDMLDDAYAALNAAMDQGVFG